MDIEAMHHADIIEQLGGTSKVAEDLGKTATVISNWKGRGIPWPQRASIAKLAEEKGVTLPADFFGIAA